jgi:tRNA-specific 2-thiouridylase
MRKILGSQCGFSSLMVKFVVQGSYNERMSEPDKKNEAIKGDQKDQNESEAAPKTLRENAVVVGFTGSADSVVTAYLLRKQGFEVIGMAIDFFSTEMKHFEPPPILPTVDEPQGYLAPEDLRDSLKPHCHVNSMDEIKKLADRIEIDFYGVKAHEIYQDQVLDPMIAAKLEGKYFYPCLNCHTQIIRLLKAKAELLGVKKIATGHYAKINFMARDKTYHVVGAQDKDWDQSYLFSGLSNHELADLILPLSSIRKSEVTKIVESMKWQVLKNKIPPNSCFRNSKAVAQWIDRRVAVDLRKNGQLIRYEDETFIADHQGVHYFEIGDTSELVKTQGLAEADLQIVAIRRSQGTVSMAATEKLSFKELWLSNFHASENSDLSRPLEVYCQIGPNLERHKAIFLAKALGFCHLVLEQPISGMAKPGAPVFLYDKALVSGAKLIGQGEVHLNAAIDALANVTRSDDTDEDDEKKKSDQQRSKLEIKL